MNDSGQTKNCLQVLHLEDDPLCAELIRTKLEDCNIPSVFSQVQTQLAFESALQQNDVDLILSDSQLPGFDTMLALTLSQQKRPEIPFIFVSGAASPNIKEEAFRRGAVDFISKDELPKLARVIQWLFFVNKRRGRKPALPQIGAPVMLQCKGFRCLGYLDRNGEWWDFGTSGKLSDITDWFDV